jgi:F-type H+-transporting ATPase subunit delta
MAEAFALRYAQALYDSDADDPAFLERAGFEIEKFQEISKKFPDLAVYFDSPLVTLQRKYKFIANMAEELEISVEVHGLFRAIVKRGRFFHIDQIVKAYKELLEAEDGGADTLVFTAKPLTEAEETFIKERLEVASGKRLHAKFKVDKTILGGVRAEVGHKIYDSSLRNSLNILKERMVGEVS